MTSDGVALRGVTYSYRVGGFTLGPIDVCWPRGLIGLLGPNGAGKTTLLNLLAGVRRPQHGAVNLLDHLDEKLGRLSGGQHRRAVVAFGLVHDPEVLILDEPTAGLDPHQRISLRETLSGLARDRLVVVSTHLVEDVASVADWVTIIDGGRVAYDSAMADLPPSGDSRASALEAQYLRVAS